MQSLKQLPLLMKATFTAPPNKLLKTGQWLFLLLYSNYLLAQPPVELNYRVVASHPHDNSLFTQGILLYQDQLYESGGLYGQSRLISRQLNTANPDHEYRLHDSVFAEGIAEHTGLIYQLSWRAQQGYIYQADTLQRIGHFNYHGEGWGLTSNDQYFIMSNGSEQLSFRSLDDFSETKRISVTDNGKAVTKINELEWVEGLIAANLWQSNSIVFIAPNSGHVVAKLDLANLLAKTNSAGVLNGIAYNPTTQRLYITGKRWPLLFELELSPFPTASAILN